MTDLTLIILLAAALLVLLWVAARREPGGRTYSISDGAEGEFTLRLPRYSLMERVLSVEDLKFVAETRSADLVRLLLVERRRLAIAWLRQTRREAGRLLRFHAQAARHAAGLRPALELKLMAHAAAFLAVYEVLVGAVRLYGPFRTEAFLRSLHRLAGLLSRLGGRMADLVYVRVAEQTSGGKS